MELYLDMLSRISIINPFFTGFIIKIVSKFEE